MSLIAYFSWIMTMKLLISNTNSRSPLTSLCRKMTLRVLMSGYIPRTIGILILKCRIRCTRSSLIACNSIILTLRYVENMNLIVRRIFKDCRKKIASIAIMSFQKQYLFGSATILFLGQRISTRMFGPRIANMRSSRGTHFLFLGKIGIL